MQYISDIHLEMWASNPAFYQQILKPSAPYLILAGDICSYEKRQKLKPFLEYCSVNWDKIFMVAGNHEYYAYKTPMSRVEEWLKEECAAFPNIHFLQKETYNLEEKYAIIGATLWTHIDPEIDYEVYAQMNDFKKITNDDGTCFKPDNCRQLYQDHAQFIDNAINSALLNDYIPIVITHHLPSPALIHPKYVDSHLNSCYASPFLDYMHDKPSLWFYGHSHVQGVKDFKHTKCCINALGYPGELKAPPEPAIVELPTV